MQTLYNIGDTLYQNHGFESNPGHVYDLKNISFLVDSILICDRGIIYRDRYWQERREQGLYPSIKEAYAAYKEEYKSAYDEIAYTGALNIWDLSVNAITIWQSR